MIPWWQGLLAIGAGTVVGPLVLGPRIARRVVAALVALATLSVPFLVAGGPALGVTACALLCVLGPIKLVQLGFDPVARSASFRVWHASMPFDARQSRRVAPGLDPSTGLALVGHTAALGLGLWVIAWAGTLDGLAAPAVRFVAGMVGVYCGTAAAAALYEVGHRLVGVEIPPLMRAPILSRSIAEFWGRRWNRPVHELLRAAFFAPLARRGWVRAGFFAAFLGSAVLHLWIVVFALGPKPATIMAAFFVVQGLLALVEDRLRVRRWRPAAAHAWTLGTFTLSAPLFIEPFLRALGI